MRCERAQEQFSEYHEGTLGRSFVVALENHLNGCETCKADLLELKSVWKILDEAPAVEPPAGFRATVWQRIDAAEKAAVRRPAFAFNWRSLFARPAIAFAAAVLLLAVLVPVVLPGTRAGLFSWPPFNVNRGTNQRISALPATVQMVDGEQLLVVPLRANGSQSLLSNVRVVSGPGTLDAQSGSVELGTPSPAELRLHVQPGSSGQTITIEMSWQEGGAKRSQKVDIKAP